MSRRARVRQAAREAKHYHPFPEEREADDDDLEDTGWLPPDMPPQQQQAQEPTA